jgi:hypothetical protein
MNNNDIFKKLRVALQLRDDQIVEILELVDFRISKGEIGNFFRTEDHPKFVECGDQVLRNFLNGLVIHLRGTRENPKAPTEVLSQIKAEIIKPPVKNYPSKKPADKPASDKPSSGKQARPKTSDKKFGQKATISPVENVKYTIKKK